MPPLLSVLVVIQDYCGGPSPQVTTSAMAKSTSASLSLVQCANSAFSTCQSTAMDPAASPCGKYIGGGPGYKQCNGKQFDTFYAGAQADCRNPHPAWMRMWGWGCGAVWLRSLCCMNCMQLVLGHHLLDTGNSTSETHDRHCVQNRSLWLAFS